MRRTDQELANKRAIVEELTKEERDAKVRLEKVQEELKLIADHIQAQDFEVL